jgi:hypothetical protein
MTADKFAQAVLRAVILKAPLNHRIDISSSGYFVFFRVVYNFQDDKEGYDAYSWEVYTTHDKLPWVYPHEGMGGGRQEVFVTFATEAIARQGLIDFFQIPTNSRRVYRGNKNQR